MAVHALDRVVLVGDAGIVAGEDCAIVPVLELGKLRGDPTVAQESADGIVGRAVGKASGVLQAERRSNR